MPLVAGVVQLSMEYTIPRNKENEYTIFFYNCKENAKVSFNLDIELYNTVRGQRNYLSGLSLPPLPLLPRLACQRDANVSLQCCCSSRLTDRGLMRAHT